MRDRRIRLVLAVMVVAMAGVGVAMAATKSTSAKNGTVKTAKVGKFGTVLVAANGMTLYRYTPDKKNVSVCNGACASYWPPLLVKGTAKPTVGSGASAGLIGTTMRTGGAEQVTYAGFPLYYYAGDKKPGQANGQGFQKTWYVVSATGALVKHAVAASGSGGTTTTKSGSAWG
jgi:predicted lipoprotein with Yx(FWY)xxD motif